MKNLIVCGPSGSGKSTLVKLLVQMFPDKYVKATQCTTRPRREGESPDEYKFVSHDEFKKLASSLVGITHIGENSYGSIMDGKEQRIQIFILNGDGIKDFRYIAQCLKNSTTKCLGVYRDLEKCCASRPSRDPEYIKSEFKVLEMADQTYANIYASLDDSIIKDLDKAIDILFGD